MSEKEKTADSLDQQNYETGLGNLSFFVPTNSLKRKLHVQPYRIENLREWIEAIEKQASTAKDNTALPEHIRGLADWASLFASSLLSQLQSGKPDPQAVASAALVSGLLFARLNLWQNESPASAGKRSRAAARRKGRTAPSGSVRDFFNSRLKDWPEMSTGRLLLAAKKQFPKRTQENLLRQIRNLKKGGQ